MVISSQDHDAVITGLALAWNSEVAEGQRQPVQDDQASDAFPPFR
jgi:hypothetical protein